MAEKTPRRLRRLEQRHSIKKKPKKAKAKEKKKKPGKPLLPFSLLRKADDKKELGRETTTLALKEVSHFKQKKGRYPKEKEIGKIADNIYAQLKEKYEKEDRKEKERKKERKSRGGKEEAGSLLESRRKRRGNAKKPIDEKAPETEEAPVHESLLERRKRQRTEREGKKETAPAKEAPGEETAIGTIVGEKELPKEEAGEILPKEAEEDAGKISIEGLFEKEAGTGIDGEKDELSILDISELDETNPLEGDMELISDDSDDSETITKEFETDKNKCPNCGNKSEDIIFCPVCGSGFCTHCAEKVEVLEDKIKYTCPKCRGEFKVNKH